jgi:poly-gamma-glutamate capsule biosynthesis protein CapA/YwtB (metallophosphatase superfamily)
MIPSAKCLIFFLCILSLAVTAENKDTIPTEDTLTITGVGDIMLGTAFPSKSYLPPNNNPMPLIENVVEYLSASDLTFGNLEGALLDHGKTTKKCKDTTICYAFRMPEKYVDVIKKAGFDILSIANNHVGDFGNAGKEKTKALLDSAEIHATGLLECPYSIFSKDSVVYGFCSFSPNNGTVSINDIPNAEKIVKHLEEKCDVVIVSFHGGAEGSKHQRVPKTRETFYGENRGDVYDFAHKMIDAGADIIFGHGPHVSRAIEVYNERFITYSMGNFCTYKRFNLKGPNGYAPIVTINIDKTGKFIKGQIIPVYQNSMGIVTLDKNRRAIKKIRELTDLDFPSSKINISDDGIISY